MSPYLQEFKFKSMVGSSNPHIKRSQQNRVNDHHIAVNVSAEALLRFSAVDGAAFDGLSRAYSPVSLKKFG
jgi:hypothetical protein